MESWERKDLCDGHRKVYKEKYEQVLYNLSYNKVGIWIAANH